MASRRSFLSMLARAIAAPLVVNRTIFLAPHCGWITPSARMIIPPRIVAESYGEALASGDFTYDAATQMMSIWNRPDFRPDAKNTWKYERSEVDKRIMNAGGSWKDMSEAAWYMDQHGIEHDFPFEVYVANAVGYIRKPKEIDRTPYDLIRVLEPNPMLHDSEFALISDECRNLAAARAAAIRSQLA